MSRTHIGTGREHRHHHGKNSTETPRPEPYHSGMSKCSSNFEFNSPGTLLIIPDHPRTPPQPHLQAANQPLENVNRIPPIRLQAGYYLKGGPGLSRACVAGYEGNSRPRGASIQSVRRYER
jgi:hypothetical protein